MLEYLAEESNNYAHQKAGITLQTNSSEIETFIGLYFHMGLVKMPAVGCFWETYTRYHPIADVMARQRFQRIASYLHIVDNLKVTEEEKKDKAWKIRRWFDDLNANFSEVSPSENQCVDEIMVAFKGRSILKQYLPKKPKKWGFKLWARCSSTGFLHVFDIYQGKGTGMDDNDNVPDCGLGGNVVLKLCSALPSDRNFKVFADNFFSNFAMVSELEKRGLHYVGTINSNRLHGAPLKSEKELKKEGRGAHDSVVETTKNLSLVRWFDNKCVTMISSYIGAEEVDSVRRYDRSKKEHVNVERPSLIGVYNKSMGGVDLMDMLCTLYKYQLRSKRWYLYIFYHTLTIALVNAWLLYRRDCKALDVRVMPLRKFQAMVAAALCNVKKSQRGRRSLDCLSKKKKEVNPAPVTDVRFDGVGHMPSYEDKRQRCRNCPEGFAFVKCVKCKVHLCLNKNRNCFLAYHSK
ncbi:piggyBac transposable element-derived protein 2-like [Dendronephthya gigantea]|uniref:piggyBac transposable element-derived protein 2-like n=1 Tax=Dendronephthya gigantea TaxID=151771 RepID=UPI00106B8C13|nr:piggyBac transposable element-derived protein 2-like [Dendronephthya gigantea]XP_028407459.1 piggyBac transposable element-derived protein 2-like [Dendronephthya gigantea]